MSNFKRFVYAPKAYAFIYSRKQGQVLDVSNDIVAGSVQRLVDQPSKASITLNNKNFQYTGKFNPEFYPMDGITIWLQKVAGAPIQQFTGYIDSIPYFQAYPGTITIEATCTLKRFMYTYFDPGIGFMQWIQDNGWNVQGSGGNITGIFDPGALVDQLGKSGTSGTDGGMGQLLRKFLTDIGGASPDSIAIGDIPPDLPKAMIKTYLKRVHESQAAEKALIPALERYFTMSVNQDSGDGSSAIQASLASGKISASANITDLKNLVSSIEGSTEYPKPTAYQIILGALIMSGLDKSHKGTDSSVISYGEGYFADANVSVGEGAAAHGHRVVGNPKGQGKRFCSLFAKFFKNTAAVTTAGAGAAEHGGQYGAAVSAISTELQVAAVLAFQYGHDQFYSQILAACNDSGNKDLAQKIVGDINSNQSLDNVKTTDYASAENIVSQNAPNQITWDALFNGAGAGGGDAATVKATEVNGTGKSGGTTVGINYGETYTYPKGGRWVPKTYSGSDTITNPSPRFKVNGVPLKYSEIKYFIFTRSGGTNSKGFKSVFDPDGAVGKIVEVKNKKNGSVCRCVYMGATSINDGQLMQPNSPILLSSAALNLIGSDPNIEFTFTSDSIPEKTKDRKKYIKSILDVLGTPPASTGGSGNTGGPGNINVNEDDKAEYQKDYTKANNRLAEYFYIASTYDLHLLKNAKPGKNALLLTGNDQAQALKFLVDMGVIDRSSTVDNIKSIGVAQTVADHINVTFTNGATAFNIKFHPEKNLAGSDVVKLSGSNIIPDALKKAQIVIEITSGPSLPSPVWNGQGVVLPADLTGGGNGSGATSYTVTWQDLARMNTAAAFTTLTNFPFDLVGSAFLVGDKSLMNDVPVMQGIQQFCQGSMRSFMSLPNGMFAAFYPDRFGAFGRTPYLNIKDLEIVDFNIVLNDEALVTHMYVNGNTINPLDTSSFNNQLNQVLSVGVITIDDMFQSNTELNFVNNPEAATGTNFKTPDNIDLSNSATPAGYTQYTAGLSDEALKFLQAYGPRPKVENNPLIRSPWFEFVVAYNNFAYSWSATTATNVQLTFMPELMAGGLVRFPEHNIIMYCEAVHHTWNYESGFETTAYLSSPSTELAGEEEPVPGMVIFNKV
jgi:hypothetical protein